MENEQQVSLFDDANEGNLAIRRDDKWFELVPIEEGSPEEERPDEAPFPSEEDPRRKRKRVGSSDQIMISVRLSHLQWANLKAAQITTRMSFQEMGVHGLDLTLKEWGLPPL